MLLTHPSTGRRTAPDSPLRHVNRHSAASPEQYAQLALARLSDSEQRSLESTTLAPKLTNLDQTDVSPGESVSGLDGVDGPTLRHRNVPNSGCYRGAVRVRRWLFASVSSAARIVRSPPNSGPSRVKRRLSPITDMIRSARDGLLLTQSRHVNRINHCNPASEPLRAP